MSETPSILVLTSRDCESAVVTPVLAALDVRGLNVRAFDAGHQGHGAGAVEWVVRAISGEMVERQLDREIETIRPDLVLCFEPGPTQTVCALRRKCARPFVVVAVIPQLNPSASWGQCEADRFLVIDDYAAVDLEEQGIEGERIVPVGAMGEVSYADAGTKDRSVVRDGFKVSGKVVLVEVAGLGQEGASQLALQLSLIESDVLYLFDAGADRDAASALRTQVPLLGMRAKLFGDTLDAPLLWRSSDAVVARPTIEAVSRATSVGAPLVCFEPRDSAETRRSSALEERGRGAIAANALMVGPALLGVLANKKVSHPAQGQDGAATIADAVSLLAEERSEILDERLSSKREARQDQVEDATRYAEWAASAAQPAGALEDLGGGSKAPAVPSVASIRRLQVEIRERKAQLARTIADAQKQASAWDSRLGEAKKLDNAAMVKKAERNADMERARMHSALASMASLQVEERGLEAAAAAAAAAPKPKPKAQTQTADVNTGGTSVYESPSVDEELDRLRRSAGDKPAKKKPTKKKRRAKGNAVDDELAALKRKMAKKR